MYSCSSPRNTLRPANPGRRSTPAAEPTQYHSHVTNKIKPFALPSHERVADMRILITRYTRHRKHECMVAKANVLIKEPIQPNHPSNLKRVTRVEEPTVVFARDLFALLLAERGQPAGLVTKDEPVNSHTQRRGSVPHFAAP